MYKRVLLKISGEALLGKEEFGIDYEMLAHIADEVIAVRNAGHEVAVVIGAGNIWRFRDNQNSGIERTASDTMGMMGTIMNSVALQSALDRKGASSRVCSSINVPQVAEPYIRRKALRHLEKGRIVICAGGTGNPYFTTDTAAALRGLELECNVIIKATNVDGVYDSDPRKNPDAKMYTTLNFQEVIEKNLKVMDQAAFSLCREKNLPILVINFFEKGNLLRAVSKHDVGTLIKD